MGARSEGVEMSIMGLGARGRWREDSLILFLGGRKGRLGIRIADSQQVQVLG